MRGWKGKTSTAVLGVRKLATLVGFILPTSSAVYVFPAVNIYLSLTNSWVRMTDGDLPEPSYIALHWSTAIVQHNDSHWWGELPEQVYQDCAHRNYHCIELYSVVITLVHSS